MPLLTWNHACSVGIRAMDDQHGILMDSINELRLALMHGCSHEKTCELLDQFIEFARMHFFSEERLMEEAGFSGLAAHRAEHHRMLAEILQAAHRLQYGEVLHLRPLMSQLHDGFLEHIELADQQYGPWLRDHGID
ncbi:MAG TPA: bacteriohemerythrin [Terracidiphilus sp.]